MYHSTETTPFGTVTNFSLARYNPNGTLDTSFGMNGIATANFGSTPGTAGSSKAVIQPDGKIDVVGISSDFKTIELARFNADGSLDATFGQGGQVTTPLPSSEFNSYEQALLLQPTGGLVVTTDVEGGGYPGHHWDLIGYNADGSLNTSFGTGGFVRTPPAGGSIGSGDTAVMAYAAQYPVAGTANDGKIVMVGEGFTPNGIGEILVRRYNSNGTLDSTFGSGGRVFTPVGPYASGAAYGVVIQPDGKIVVTGTSAGGSGQVQAVVRYNTDGSLDTTFDTGGIVTTPIGTENWGNDVALQSNGDIVIVGQGTIGNKTDFSVTRYLGDSPSFTVTGFPSPRTAGVAGTFTVTARDASGNKLTGYTGTVHFTSSDPRAVLPVNYTFTAADNGTHTFSATLKTAGSQSITAADTATSTMLGSQAGITITPAAASQFILSAPSSVTHGQRFSLTLTVKDAYGNVVTGYRGTVHFRSSDGTATLPVNYTFTAADAGVHQWVNALILRKRGKQTITLTDTLFSVLTATDSITVG